MSKKEIQEAINDRTFRAQLTMAREGDVERELKRYNEVLVYRFPVGSTVRTSRKWKGVVVGHSLSYLWPQKLRIEVLSSGKTHNVCVGDVTLLGARKETR